MPPTLEEVAKLADVSRSTVSRVINDQPNVRPETRARVWQAIHKSGYRPHAVARSLVTNRTQIIGMLIPETVTTLFADPFFPLLLRGATEACNNHHYQLMLSLFTSRSAEQDMYQRVLGNGYLDGAIVASAAADDPLIPSLLHDRIQLVSVGRYADDRVPYVDVDNVGGARMAVEHLIRLGHRRIGIITGRLDMTHGQDRLSGYKDALQAHHMPLDEDLIAEGDYSESSGMTAMHQLLDAAPTAAFVCSDSMAIGALKALHEVGLSVPQDMALVGFDNVPLAAAMQPPLTTIRQPIERLGALAVDVLISMLGSPPDASAPAQKIVLSTELVIRQSCGALQGSP
jgi:LacI family transcriptional regulator